MRRPDAGGQGTVRRSAWWRRVAWASAGPTPPRPSAKPQRLFWWRGVLMSRGLGHRTTPRRTWRRIKRTPRGVDNPGLQAPSGAFPSTRRTGVRSERRSSFHGLCPPAQGWASAMPRSVSRFIPSTSSPRRGGHRSEANRVPPSGTRRGGEAEPLEGDLVAGAEDEGALEGHARLAWPVEPEVAPAHAGVEDTSHGASSVFYTAGRSSATSSRARLW